MGEGPLETLVNGSVGLLLLGSLAVGGIKLTYTGVSNLLIQNPEIHNFSGEINGRRVKYFNGLLGNELSVVNSDQKTVYNLDRKGELDHVSVEPTSLWNHDTDYQYLNLNGYQYSLATNNVAQLTREIKRRQLETANLDRNAQEKEIERVLNIGAINERK